MEKLNPGEYDTACKLLAQIECQTVLKTIMAGETPGVIYVDSKKKPKLAFAQFKQRTFLSGVPSTDLGTTLRNFFNIIVREHCQEYDAPFFRLTTNHPQWLDIMVNSLQPREPIITGYHCYQRIINTKIENISLPDGFEIISVDQELINAPFPGREVLLEEMCSERKEKFHIGEFEEIDDFPMLWTWFEEDALLENMGHPRLHTTSDGYFKYQYLWDLLIERICLEYQKMMRDFNGDTIILEFSRGSEHGGYRSAFEHLSQQVLQDLAILYVDIPWEESLRKNRRRFNPDRPDSILEHGLPDEKLEKLYRETDWHDLVKGHMGKLSIQNVEVPFGVFDNADDVTTKQGPALGARLSDVLDELWQIYAEMHKKPKQ